MDERCYNGDDSRDVGSSQLAMKDGQCGEDIDNGGVPIASARYSPRNREKAHRTIGRRSAIQVSAISRLARSGR
jgi:hypothetical protein